VSSESFHERYEDLSAKTRDLHRAILSLMEELEAIDWYQQRVDATHDDELRAVLAHNRDEEIEHAMMNLEWLRRHSDTIDAAARTFLFSEGPITEVEERLKAAEVTGDAAAAPGPSAAGPGAAGGLAGRPTPTTVSSSDGSLGIGSLKLV
jgi:ferritin-like protein